MFSRREFLAMAGVLPFAEVVPSLLPAPEQKEQTFSQFFDMLVLLHNVSQRELNDNIGRYVNARSINYDCSDPKGAAKEISRMTRLSPACFCVLSANNFLRKDSIAFKRKYTKPFALLHLGFYAESFVTLDNFSDFQQGHAEVSIEPLVYRKIQLDSSLTKAEIENTKIVLHAMSTKKFHHPKWMFSKKIGIYYVPTHVCDNTVFGVDDLRALNTYPMDYGFFTLKTTAEYPLSENL
jgi:hypothetical protein